MKIIALDFETYYDKDFSLSKMTTEEYIRDERFETIGVGIKEEGQDARWHTGTHKQTKAFLDSLELHKHLVLAHNAIFDAAILNWHFDIRPAGWLDTLSMARALHTIEVGGSLAALATYYNIGAKGSEVVAALGKKRTDFTAADMAQYGEYCKNDAELTLKLFQIFSQDFDKSELKLIDLTIRMFSEPVLELNRLVLEVHLKAVKETKEHLMNRMLIEKDDLMSNPKLAGVLENLGVTPPRKISLTTGKETYAFAKNDEEFKALLEHPDVIVQAIVAARLGVKSTLDETRTARFIGIAARGTMPVPLRYYAAHTGRWGGDDKVNLQNLPRGSAIKAAILAPDGQMMIDSDSSQIEARTLAWLAEQEDLVATFENGEDVYKKMAAAIYGKEEEDITKDERFVGKTTILGCIGAGTQVLCDSGWKPIEQVTITDKLWDGKEWVCHQGLLTKGLKQTLNLCGVWLTPDHKVLSGTQWLEAQLVVRDESILCRALGTGAENLPLLATSQGKDMGSKRLSYGVTVGYLNTQLTIKTLRTLKALAVMFAPRRQRMVSVIGSMLTPCTTMRTALGYLTDCPQRLQGATTLVLHTTPIMGGEVSKSMLSGGRIGQRFLGMYRPLKVGTLKSLKWIGSTITKGTSRAISGSHLGAPTCKTGAKCPPLSKNLQTYDIAYSGPRNRFTILTERGPILVHNCGYGMGAAKFQAQLKTFKVEMPLEETQRIIAVYRDKYPQITKLWRQAGDALKAIMQDQTAPLGRDGVLFVEGKKGIRLPNGLYIRYPNLRMVTNDDGKAEMVYDTKRGKTTVPNRIYGGKVVENVCQALARIIIGKQMLQIARKYKVVMTVHDAVACVVPEAEVHTAQEYVEMCMRTRPSWGMELPLNCESGHGRSYGEC